MLKLFALISLFSFSLLPQEGEVKTYYPSGGIKEEVTYSNNIREGEARLYHENGELKEERLYVNGRIEGLIKVYSENGKLRQTINIEDGKRNGPTSLFDENGVYIKDLYYEDGKLIRETPLYPEPLFASGEDENSSTESQPVAPPVRTPKRNTNLPPPPMVEEERYEDDPAVFLTAEIMPEPVGGMETIYKKLVYPKEARERGIQGTVRIGIMVDEYGEVQSAQVIEGIGYGCDEAARLAVYYTKFKPALQRGKAVKIQTEISIDFKLQ
jgi:TonB family protein